MLQTTEAPDLSTRALTAPAAPEPRRRPTSTKRVSVGSVVKWVVLGIASFVMLVPLYVMVISAFKPESEILSDPLAINPDTFTWDYLVQAIQSPNFNVVGAYGITLFFVLAVNVLSIAVSAPVAYVIARGRTRWYAALLLLFVSGLFVPSQVILIPVVFVLRSIGLMGTIPGFLLFETAVTLPMTIFLFTAFVRTIPRDIDEAASIDGAGRVRAFWSCIFPLMRPIVATMIVLNSVGVWNDFVNPQIILGPGSGIYTVTTGVFAAVGQYTTDYNVVFPTLLLAVAPVLIFFIIMQRHIIGGLVAGSTKG